ncbi:hypothetical protein RhiirA5_410148 [Rhizophagus irregularis]|uniref:Uncharacterized protein n=1 Tax=Rhizophagus irregularis TaxID=588596 RepID=A0A2N0Q409_9GLOM|nr:hypothetical protein RhiirA5_410148 [Rhizophagus irregularis]PKC72785.1 hypothetical protein RhiirA1_451970 [Rhizophagus irregularis]
MSNKTLLLFIVFMTFTEASKVDNCRKEFQKCGENGDNAILLTFVSGVFTLVSAILAEFLSHYLNSRNRRT